jgi:hypothetical protein
MSPSRQSKLGYGNFLLGFKILICGVALLGSSGMASATGTADTTAAIQVELMPSTLKLAAGEKRLVTVVARNVSPASIQKLHLGWTSPPGVTVTDQTGDKETLAAGASTRWSVEVATAGTLTDAAHIYFLFDYLQPVAAASLGPIPSPSTPAAAPWPPAAAPATTNPGSVSAILEIQQRAPIALEKLVEVRAESSLKLLQDPHKGKIYVVVNNKSAIPVTVEAITPQAPEDDIVVDKITTKKLVGPQAQEAFALTVTADKKGVNPGTHVVLFKVDLSWKEENVPQTASIVSKYEFDVGVIGNELLTAVGVPTLLLLPGFMMILVFATLWNNIGTRPQIPLNLKSGEFWALAVLLSLTTALVYPYFSQQRNYLDRYGLLDVYRIWFGSAAVGLIAWVIAVSTRWLWLRTQKKKQDAITFLTSDGPIEVLRKLARNNRPFLLDQANLRIGDKPIRVLILHPGGNGQKARVAPRVVVKFKADLAPAAKPDLEKQIAAHLLKTNAPDELADFLVGAQAHLEIRWDTSDALTGVTEAEATEPAGAAPQTLVQYE